MRQSLLEQVQSEGTGASGEPMADHRTRVRRKQQQKKGVRNKERQEETILLLNISNQKLKVYVFWK